MEAGCSKVVKCGDATLFWLEDWTGKGCLSIKYHRLYNLSRQKRARVSECGSWVQQDWLWDLRWRRPLHGREVSWLQALLLDVKTSSLVEGARDK